MRIYFIELCPSPPLFTSVFATKSLHRNFGCMEINGSLKFSGKSVQIFLAYVQITLQSIFSQNGKTSSTDNFLNLLPQHGLVQSVLESCICLDQSQVD